MPGEYLGKGWAARRVGILRAPGEAVDVAVTVQARWWFPRWAVLQVNRNPSTGIIRTAAVLEEGRGLHAITAAARAVVAAGRWARLLQCRPVTDAEVRYPLAIDEWSQQGG